MQDNKELSHEAKSKKALSIREIGVFYEELREIYSASDKWHQQSHNWIHNFIHSALNASGGAKNRTILNLGSGGQSYDLPEHNLVHVDLITKNFSPPQRLLKCDIHSLPFEDGSFDICICVGSVINYCDAAVVLQNIQRVLRARGTLILEFESSRSLDLMFSNGFCKSAALVDTFYQDKKVRLWAYSEKYLLGLLDSFGLAVTDRESFYHIAPLIYLVTRSSNLSAGFQKLDFFCSRVPWLRTFSGNIILSCRKT